MTRMRTVNGSRIALYFAKCLHYRCESNPLKYPATVLVGLLHFRIHSFAKLIPWNFMCVYTRPWSSFIQDSHLFFT